MVDGSLPTGDAELLGPLRAEALEKTAERIGLYCQACGMAMDGPGFEFIALLAKIKDGKPHIEVSRTYICHREDCAKARTEGHLKATAVRRAGGWTILAGEPGMGEHSGD